MILLRTIALVALCLAGAAVAQETDPKSVPDLGLSDAQRHTIYLSIVNQRDKRNAAPETFHPAVGAEVPASVPLAPLPDTIVSLMPNTKGYRYALVAGRVIVVTPKDRRIVDVISKATQ